jgi:hypothetical protein
MGLPSGRHRARVLFSLMLVAFLVTTPPSGVGGDGVGGSQTDPGTPLGTYTVTVKAISGALSHSTSFSLVAQ